MLYMRSCAENAWTIKTRHSRAHCCVSLDRCACTHMCCRQALRHKGQQRHVTTPQQNNAGAYSTYVRMPAHQDYETLKHPTGLLLCIKLHSTWGDAYYIGLDSLQICGADGKPVAPAAKQVRASYMVQCICLIISARVK